MSNAKKPERTEFDLTWHTEKPRCGTLGIKNGGAVANIQYWLSGKTDSEITKKIGEYLLNACNSHDRLVADNERLVGALESVIGQDLDEGVSIFVREALRTVGEGGE